MQSHKAEDIVSRSPLAAVGSEMKQDMDLVRRILLEVESWNDLIPKSVKIDGVDDLPLNREVERLYDAKYLEGFVLSERVHSPYKIIAVKDLSMDGFDFLNSIRDPGVWDKTKERAVEIGGYTLGILKEIAKGILKENIERLLGS
jgi:Hypothetical protein (DUF2513)